MSSGRHKLTTWRKVDFIRREKNRLKSTLKQWRHEGVCRPVQTCVLPPLPIRSVLQSEYFSGFRTSGRVWTNFWGPLLFPTFLLPPYPFSLSSYSTPLHLPSLPLKVGPLNKAIRSGSAVFSFQQGLGQSPGRNRIWCILALKSHIRLQQI